jgi:hypothetical protein
LSIALCLTKTVLLIRYVPPYPYFKLDMHAQIVVE